MPLTETSESLRHPYVERKEQVCGGRPVIRGTRFPISSIVWNHKLGLTVEEMLREFPQLAPAQIYGALAYYYEHQSEIEEEIRQAQDVEAWMKKYPPTLKVKNGRHPGLGLTLPIVSL